MRVVSFVSGGAIPAAQQGTVWAGMAHSSGLQWQTLSCCCSRCCHLARAMFSLPCTLFLQTGTAQLWRASWALRCQPTPARARSMVGRGARKPTPFEILLFSPPPPPKLLVQATISGTPSQRWACPRKLHNTLRNRPQFYPSPPSPLPPEHNLAAKCGDSPG